MSRIPNQTGQVHPGVSCISIADATQKKLMNPSQPHQSLKHRLDVAWPNDLLAALGPKQRKLLCDWTQKDEMEHGEDYLTVPVLEGMMEMVKAYYPEATVVALEVLSAKSSKDSESLSTIIASQIKKIAIGVFDGRGFLYVGGRRCACLR